MGLIVTDRHTARDLARWRRAAEECAATTPGTVRSARRVIHRWHDLHGPDGYVLSVSWGKDSCVLLHLAIGELDGDLPLIRRGLVGGRNPDTDLTRDAWLDLYPQVATRYAEVEVRSLQQDLAPDVGHRAMHGVRAAESEQRRRSGGFTTRRTCRPLLNWTLPQVLGHLIRHDLPIHPAYGYLAMEGYGLDRIRVHSLGGTEGGPMRSAWEAHYYPETAA